MCAGASKRRRKITSSTEHVHRIEKIISETKLCTRSTINRRSTWNRYRPTGPNRVTLYNFLTLFEMTCKWLIWFAEVGDQITKASSKRRDFFLTFGDFERARIRIVFVKQKKNRFFYNFFKISNVKKKICELRKLKMSDNFNCKHHKDLSSKLSSLKNCSSLQDRMENCVHSWSD